MGALLSYLRGDSSKTSNEIMRDEVSAKITYHRTSEGLVAILSVDPEGKNIVLENISSGISRTDVNLHGFKLQRNIDGKYILQYNFTNFTLKPGKQVKIWGKGSSSQAGPNDLVHRAVDSWGIGSNITTTLFNDKSEEEASHIQKTIYN